MRKQNILGIRDTVNNIANPQTHAGYALLNISFGYNLSKQFSFFATMKEEFENIVQN
jgi:hypothetical protein